MARRRVSPSNPVMMYSIRDARLQFSLWSACRAAQAGSAKAKRRDFIFALEKCGVLQFIAKNGNHSTSVERYDQQFDFWVQGAQRYLFMPLRKRVS
jgi:hypothetical protein